MKIHFFIESGLKMIEFKTKSKIFIRKIFIQLSKENLIELFIKKTLPKALRTQALTALTSNFGLVRWIWLGRFGLVGLVW